MTESEEVLCILLRTDRKRSSKCAPSALPACVGVGVCGGGVWVWVSVVVCVCGVCGGVCVCVCVWCVCGVCVCVGGVAYIRQGCAHTGR